MDVSSIAVISSSVVAAVAVLGLIFTHYKEHGELKERIKGLETKMEPFWKAAQDIVPALLRQQGKGNPVPVEVRDDLLKKLQYGTITPDEGKELEDILRHELREAQDRKDTAVVLAIVLGLALIAVVLASRK